MEIFCCETLEIKDFTISFSPNITKPRRPRLLNISLLNIPPEPPEDTVTEFINEYADIEGFPFYPKKTYNGVFFCTRTRVYQVSKLHQHIPRKLYNMFGRTVICIYNDQPNRNQRELQRLKRTYYTPTETQSDEDENQYETETTQTESETESENETEKIAETQDNPTNKSQRDANNTEENIHKNVTRRKQNQNPHKPEYTMDKTPPEKNDENYPTIPNSNNIRKQENATEQKQKSETKEPTIIPKTQIIPETQTNNSPTHTSNNDTQQPGISNTSTSAQEKIINMQIITSPTLVSNRFRILKETPDQEDINTPDTTPTNNETDNEILTPTSPTPKSKRQIRLEARLYKAKKFTTQLQTGDFCDTGNLNNAIKQEKPT